MKMMLRNSRHFGLILPLIITWRNGGCYRRYGQLEIEPNTLEKTLLPHEPYVQPSYINTLNGDVKRFFDPLSSEFVNSPVLNQLLRFMAESYNKAIGESVKWNVRLHPYRIIAREGESGLPTPEGLHRDGVTFIASVLLKRENIQGGVTDITNSEKTLLATVKLTELFDLVLADDEKTMHSVTPIVVDQRRSGLAYRDVLVIAFTKL